jgi:DNA-binding NarL/FixJ family response regulator
VLTYTSGRGQLRVLLVDGCSTYRAGLRHALAGESNLLVVGEAGTSAEALVAASSLQPDAAIVDVHLHDRAEPGICQQLIGCCPGIAVLVLSNLDWDIYLAEAWSDGAAGFLSKRATGREVAHAVQQAVRGQIFTLEQLRRIATWETALGDQLRSLGSRERDVLRLVATGSGNREIAWHLDLSENTVEKYVSNILRKLDARSRTELLALVLQHRLDVAAEPGPRRILTIEEAAALAS